MKHPCGQTWSPTRSLSMRSLLILVAILASFACGQASAAGSETQKLLEEMGVMQREFESKGSDDFSLVEEDFPKAMQLLSFGVELPVDPDDNRARIEAMVGLALATVRFDETISAGEILAEDYVRDGNKSIYVELLTKDDQSQTRRQLLDSIRGHAENLNDAE